MNLALLIQAFHSSEMELGLAIQSDDQAEILRLDAHISSVFDEIMLSDAESRDEVVKLIDFLLEKMTPKDMRTELEQRIVEKLTSLV